MLRRIVGKVSGGITGMRTTAAQAERMIVLSIWLEDRCTASFRMSVRDAGRFIASAADAMGRALSPQTREIVRVALPRWRVALQRIPRRFRHREFSVAGLPSDAGVRVLRIVDDSTSASHR